MATSSTIHTRRALLIGNSNYKFEQELKSCEIDAKDVNKKLNNIGFESLSCHPNLTHEAMKKEIEEFESQIRDNDLIVFVFSGHGIQRDHRNYLIGVDQNTNDNSVSIRPENYICVQTILNSMRSKCSPYAIVFLLDCCRSYPAETKNQDEPKSCSIESNTFNDAGKKVHAGYIIVFACGPNQTAPSKSLDGEHSLFTHHLLKHIGKPCLDVGDMMISVCEGVAKDTKDKIYIHQDIALKKKVYLNGARNGKNIPKKRKKI